MSEKSNPVSQKARDEAIRALASRGGLTPDQISELKLSQVHLTTGTLVVQPEESALADQPATVKLDGNTHRAIIAWMVVRPDSSNDHLFPGAGLAGLDATVIREVVAAAEKPPTPASPPSPGAQAGKPMGVAKPPTPAPPAPGAQAGKPAEARKVPPPAAPPGARSDKPVGLPEAIVKRPSSRPVRPSAPPAATGPSKGAVPKPPSPPPPPESVPLDEIEALRSRLAEVYDDWSPVVATPPSKVEAPPAPPVEEEVEPAVDLEELVETLIAPAPVEAEIPPAPEAEVEEQPTVVARPSPRRREEEREQTVVARPRPAPAVEKPVSPPAARPMTPAGEWLRKASQDKITLNLSYRAMALSGLALVVVCCLGLVAVSGLVFGIGGAGDLLAEATPTPTETELPTPLPPSPTPSPTATSTLAPSPTATLAPTLTPVPPAPTVGPTSTPVVIVVTATPSPTSPATATRVPATARPAGASPTPTVTPTAAFKYPAPVLTWPEDNTLIPTKIALLKWDPVGPLAEDEWYAVRLVFQRRGQTVYEGDTMRAPEWWLPERLYFMADGPALEYHWFVFVERHNADGSTTQLSPESKTLTFSWR